MVEVKILEDKKTRLVAELGGADHTLCNSIKHELWNDSHVKVAGYHVKHPLIGTPALIIETDTSETPRKAIIDAAKRLKKLNEKIGKDIARELR